MALNEEQYDSVADSLDGRDASLNDQQRALAEEILRNERALRPAMAVDVPEETLRRVKHRLAGFTAGRRDRRWLKWTYLSAGAAAAAMVLIAVSLFAPTRSDPQVETGQMDIAAWYTPVVAAEVDIDLLALELDELEAEWLAATPTVSQDELLDTVLPNNQDLLNDSAEQSVRNSKREVHEC